MQDKIFCVHDFIKTESQLTLLHGFGLGERSSGGIWKFRTSSFKCYVDHSHTLYSSGNIDVRNWVHLFQSRSIKVIFLALQYCYANAPLYYGIYVLPVLFRTRTLKKILKTNLYIKYWFNLGIKRVKILLPVPILYLARSLNNTFIRPPFFRDVAQHLWRAFFLNSYFHASWFNVNKKVQLGFNNMQTFIYC